LTWTAWSKTHGVTFGAAKEKVQGAWSWPQRKVADGFFTKFWASIFSWRPRRCRIDIVPGSRDSPMRYRGNLARS
jgi:hypothetical protein